MTRFFILALATWLLSTPASADDHWRITWSTGFDPQVLAAEDAYRLTNLGGLGGGGGGADQRPFDLTVAGMIELRATRLFDLPAGLTGQLSGAATIRHASGKFPKGIGILIDPLHVTSFGGGFDVRAALSTPAGSGSLTTGAGYSRTYTKDTFEYGILTLYEHRTTSLPYGFVKVRTPVMGTSALAYVETQASRLGVSLGIGWEHDF